MHGRAKSLCQGIADEELTTGDGASLIVKSIYQRGAIPVVSEVYCDFKDILSSNGGTI